MGFKSILVATDLSELSVRALACAGEMAKALEASLTVLHVVDVRGLTAGFTELDVYFDVGSVLEGLEKDAREALPGFVEKAGLPAGVPVRTEVVQGVPVDRIIDFAKDNGHDLIVLGTHGRSGFSRLFFGSVAEKVVRSAHMPVLTVGPPDEIRDEK